MASEARHCPAQAPTEAPSTARLLLLVSTLGLVPRLFDASIRPIGYNGFWHVFIARNLEREWGNLPHPPLFLFLLRAADALSHTTLAYRSVSLLAGTAVVYLFGRLLLKLGALPAVAVLGALAAAFSQNTIKPLQRGPVLFALPALPSGELLCLPRPHRRRAASVAAQPRGLRHLRFPRSGLPLSERGLSPPVCAGAPDRRSRPPRLSAGAPECDSSPVEDGPVDASSSRACRESALRVPSKEIRPAPERAARLLLRAWCRDPDRLSLAKPPQHLQPFRPLLSTAGPLHAAPDGRLRRGRARSRNRRARRRVRLAEATHAGALPGAVVSGGHDPRRSRPIPLRGRDAPAGPVLRLWPARGLRRVRSAPAGRRGAGGTNDARPDRSRGDRVEFGPRPGCARAPGSGGLPAADRSLLERVSPVAGRPRRPVQSDRPLHRIPRLELAIPRTRADESLHREIRDHSRRTKANTGRVPRLVELRPEEGGVLPGTREHHIEKPRSLRHAFLCLSNRLQARSKAAPGCGTDGTGVANLFASDRRGPRTGCRETATFSPRSAWNASCA